MCKLKIILEAFILREESGGRYPLTRTDGRRPDCRSQFLAGGREMKMSLYSIYQD
jgi:hypothetical protein